METVFKEGDRVNVHLSTGGRIDGEVVRATDKYLEILQPKSYREKRPTVYINWCHITHVYLNGIS